MEESLEQVSPTQAGMNQNRLEEAFRLIDAEIDRGEIPGAAAIVGRHGCIVGAHASGLTMDTEGSKERTRLDTIYDCASLTKVTVTLPLILQLIEKGKLRLADKVAEFIPEFSANGKSDITIRQLLTHTSGLPPHQDLYSHGWRREVILACIYGLPLDDEPDTQYGYSDLGYIVLGELTAKLLRQSLDIAAKQHIFEPLGMKDSGFCPPSALLPRIAATEFLFGEYRRGQVHDENAYAMGGISGHAGLFSTAGDLAKYAAMWLNKGKLFRSNVLSPAAIESALRSYTDKFQARRGLGWILKGDVWDASGDLFSSSSFGHTGFTGVSIWMDMKRSLFAVLLTNRVHYGRDKSVSRLRTCFHNAIAGSIETD